MKQFYDTSRDRIEELAQEAIAEQKNDALDEEASQYYQQMEEGDVFAPLNFEE